MKNKIIIAVGVLVAAGAAFFGGIKFQQAKAAKVQPTGFNRGAGGQGGAGGGANFAGRMRGGAGANGGFVNGQIISKDDKSIIVQLPNNGGSKIIFLAASSQISKSTAGTSSDLTVGAQVLVNGSSNSDGSITAQNIQIRPAGSPVPGGMSGNMRASGQSMGN